MNQQFDPSLTGPFNTMPVNPPMFARGGHLRSMADRIQSQGTGDDTVLAHIHPIEAMQLERRYGKTINPVTGLPEYGKVFKKLAKLGKKALPLAGAIAGNMLMPGIGGSILGGALGGLGKGAMGGSHNLFKDALHGGLLGGGVGLIGNASGLFGGGATPGIAGAVKPTAEAQSSGGLFDSIKNMFTGGSEPGGKGGLFGMLGGPLNTALLGTAVYGAMNKKPRDPHKAEAQEQMNEMRNMMNIDNRKEMTHMKPYQTHYNELPMDYSPETHPEHDYFKEYADGGYVGGDGDGNEDDIPAQLEEGSFVFPAMYLAAEGNGNSNAGKKKVLNSLPPNTGEPHSGRIIKAKISSGELVATPSQVTRVGKGSNEKGAQKLQSFVNRTLKEKRVPKVLPKSRELSQYMRRS